MPPLFSACGFSDSLLWPTLGRADRPTLGRVHKPTLGRVVFATAKVHILRLAGRTLFATANAAIKRGQNGTRSSYAEREAARRCLQLQNYSRPNFRGGHS